MNTAPISPEMLPCPFCGSAKIFMEPDEYGSGGQWVYPIHVGCSACKAEIVCVDTDTTEEAIEAWNTRHSASQGVQGDVDVPGKIVGAVLGYVSATAKNELTIDDRRAADAVREVIIEALTSRPGKERLG